MTTGAQLFKLTSAATTANNYFGSGVGLAGGRAFVTAAALLAVDHAAYVFDVTTGQQLKRVTPPGGSAGFGEYGAAAGNIGLVSGSGVYVFDIVTGQYLRRLVQSPVTFNQTFPNSVALNGAGSTALVADLGDGYPNFYYAGSAYVFDVATGQQLRKLTPVDRSNNDYFGWDVAIDGNRALIGAIGDDDVGSNVGAAYLFDINTGQQLLKLIPTGAMETFAPGSQ